MDDSDKALLNRLRYFREREAANRIEQLLAERHALLQEIWSMEFVLTVIVWSVFGSLFGQAAADGWRNRHVKGRPNSAARDSCRLRREAKQRGEHIVP